MDSSVTPPAVNGKLPFAYLNHSVVTTYPLDPNFINFELVGERKRPARLWTPHSNDEIHLRPHLEPINSHDIGNGIDFRTALEISKKFTCGIGFIPVGTLAACIDCDTKRIKDRVEREAAYQRHVQLAEELDVFAEQSIHQGLHIWFLLDSKDGIKPYLKIPYPANTEAHLEFYINYNYVTLNPNPNKRNGKLLKNRHAMLLERFPQLVLRPGHVYIPQAVEPAPEPLKSHTRGEQVDDSWMRCSWDKLKGWRFPSEEEMAEQCVSVVSAIQSHLTLGPKFDKLRAERLMTEYASYSEADQALVNVVSLFTDDKFLVACIWQHSPLGRREHTPEAIEQDKHRKDRKYIPRTVNEAWNERRDGLRQLVLNATPAWGARPALPAGAAAAAPANAPCPAPGPATGVASSKAPQGERLNFPEPQELLAESDLQPSGLLGGIADYIYQVAYLPNRYVALAGAIAMLAGIAGRAFNTSTGTGLNQYLILLGRSGMGKEAAAHGASRLCASLASLAAKDVIYGYMGPAGIASPQALMRHLPIQPSLWSNLGEIAFWLQKLNFPNANPNEVQLKRLLLCAGSGC